jgi:hypothetical protein
MLKVSTVESLARVQEDLQMRGEGLRGSMEGPCRDVKGGPGRFNGASI